MTDDFKYKKLNRYPTILGEIKPSKKGAPFSVKFDIAADVSSSFHDFSKAFYFAADIIINRMLEKCHIDELDKYFFPVFFLYRHSIELLLKSIACIKLTDQTDRAVFFANTFHDPESILKHITENTTLSLPKEEMQWLQEYFHNIAKFDKASDSFRYPYHIKAEKDIFGKQKYTFIRVFEKQTHIDLIAEANKMIAAYEILENWYDNITNTEVRVSNEYIQCTSSFLDKGGSYYEQSVVGYEYHHNDFYAHCSGYLECGNFLQEYMISEFASNNIPDHLFYPVCYLYRNDVELLLKAIIFEFSGLSLQERCKILYTNKHSILKLFCFIENNILEQFDLSPKDNFIVNAKRYCDLLHNFDSDSSKFRYPVNKYCMPYQKTIKYYNCAELMEFLEALCNAIDGIHGEISSRSEAIAEMVAEYGQY